MRMLATFVSKPQKIRHFFVRRSWTESLMSSPAGKENIICYDAVSWRAGPLLSISVHCHNAVASLRPSVPAGLS
jgi:hypothetical protein